MAKKLYSHFEEHEELGSFWTPDEKFKFSGKLTYSPDKGSFLEFMCEGILLGEKIEEPYKYLHGVLKSGQKCTLLCYLDPSSMSFSSFGTTWVSYNKIRVASVLLGMNINPDNDAFTSFSVGFTNFQDFCYPQNRKIYAEYLHKPNCSAQISSDETISIVNSITGTAIPQDENIGNIFFCRNEFVNQEIGEALLPIIQKYGHDIIGLRNDIYWKLLFNTQSEISFLEIGKRINFLEHLFALLLFKPVRPIEISLRIPDSNGGIHDLPILMSFFDMDSYKIEFIKQLKENDKLPIALNKLNNFSVILKNWFQQYEKFKLFADYIDNKTNRFHHHEIRAMIVLHLTQIESIADLLKKSMNITKHEGKYDFPLNQLDKTNIRKFLQKLFENENIGQVLSDIRAEIAHVGKPPITLNTLDNYGLLQVCKCLEIIITTYIYTQLEIPEANIIEFQSQFTFLN